MAYKWRVTIEGITLRGWKKTRVSYKGCGTEMTVLLLRHHMDRAHRIVMSQTRGVDVGREGPEAYVVPFPRVLKSVVCLVDRCSMRSHNPGRLIEKLMYSIWKAKVEILQEGPAPFPRCVHCGMHT